MSEPNSENDGLKRKSDEGKVDIPPGSGGLISEINRNDVLCGRGGAINAHDGNVYFREIVNENKHGYLAPNIKKSDKVHIAATIVKCIRSLDPPGRFLKHDTDSSLWIEIGDQKARKKAGQALREDAPELRNNIEKQSTEERKKNMTNVMMQNYPGGHPPYWTHPGYEQQNSQAPNLPAPGQNYPTHMNYQGMSPTDYRGYGAHPNPPHPQYPPYSYPYPSPYYQPGHIPPNPNTAQLPKQFLVPQLSEDSKIYPRDSASSEHNMPYHGTYQQTQLPPHAGQVQSPIHSQTQQQQQQQQQNYTSSTPSDDTGYRKSPPPYHFSLPSTTKDSRNLEKNTGWSSQMESSNPPTSFASLHGQTEMADRQLAANLLKTGSYRDANQSDDDDNNHSDDNSEDMSWMERAQMGSVNNASMPPPPSQATQIIAPKIANTPTVTDDKLASTSNGESQSNWRQQILQIKALEKKRSEMLAALVMNATADKDHSEQILVDDLHFFQQQYHDSRESKDTVEGYHSDGTYSFSGSELMSIGDKSFTKTAKLNGFYGGYADGVGGGEDASMNLSVNSHNCGSGHKNIQVFRRMMMSSNMDMNMVNGGDFMNGNDDSILSGTSLLKSYKDTSVVIGNDVSAWISSNASTRSNMSDISLLSLDLQAETQHSSRNTQARNTSPSKTTYKHP